MRQKNFAMQIGDIKSYCRTNVSVVDCGRSSASKCGAVNLDAEDLQPRKVRLEVSVFPRLSACDDSAVE